MIWTVLKWVLFRLDPERAHHLAFALLRLVPPRVLRGRRRDDPALRTEALGLTFANPVGLAAGFDKDALGFRQLLALGFGSVEVGTVTPEPQPGNPRPRMFRLPAERALVNRLGFNSKGAQAARASLADRGGARVVGVNLGRNKDSASAVDDYVRGARELGPLADYVTVNVSSPNTPGLRDLQAVEELRPLLEAVKDATDRPVLVKIAPDLADDDIDAVADLAVELGIAGIIATNTTIDRTMLHDPPDVGPGGLSGAPLRARSLAVLRRLHARQGDRLVLVAAGGIEDADDAWERIRAGATLVQLYTGFVYGGPATPARIAAGLAERARRDGFEHVQQGVGAAARAVVL